MGDAEEHRPALRRSGAAPVAVGRRPESIRVTGLRAPAQAGAQSPAATALAPWAPACAGTLDGSIWNARPPEGMSRRMESSAGSAIRANKRSPRVDPSQRNPCSCESRSPGPSRSALAPWAPACAGAQAGPIRNGRASGPHPRTAFHRRMRGPRLTRRRSAPVRSPRWPAPGSMPRHSARAWRGRSCPACRRRCDAGRNNGCRPARDRSRPSSAPG